MILGAKADYIQELCCFLSIGCRILHSGVSAAHAALARGVPPSSNNLSRNSFPNASSRNRPLVDFFQLFSSSKDFFQRIDWLFASAVMQVESYLFVCVITLTCVLFPTMEGVK